MTLYHVTPDENVRSILKYGLVGRPIWLASRDTVEWALTHLSHLKGIDPLDFTCLEVLVSRAEVHAVGGKVPGRWITWRDIPAHKITVIG